MGVLAQVNFIRKKLIFITFSQRPVVMATYLHVAFVMGIVTQGLFASER